ncbi:MAG TPA: OmpA family protein [Actinomycetota bacterium]
MIPLTPLFQAVPIGSSPRPFSGTEIDPAKTSLKVPEIVPLISTAEGTVESTDATGADRSVRLSADVLFAINKSNLTPAAQSVLKQVAQQVDASSGTTVRVDGYTDNSGNDAINNPLSVARAQAVETQLKALVSRQGVSFQAAGHGSADPVADNGSEEGRRKNRRVTVTFARPAPQTSSGSGSAAPAPAAPAPAWTGGKLPVVATAASVGDNVKSVKLEINSVHRDAAGLTTMTWTLTNTGTAKFGVGFTFVDRGQEFNYDGLNVPGARLVDQAGKLTYNPLRDEGKECVCTNLNKGKGDLDPGESVTYFDSYELPPGVASVDITFPFFAPAQHVQVQ